MATESFDLAALVVGMPDVDFDIESPLRRPPARCRQIIPVVWRSRKRTATIESMIRASTGTPTFVQPTARPRQLRTIIVPASLEELHGPSAGLVTPPRRLWWSGEEGTAFDLSNRGQAAELYEAIFEAARTHHDITDHLNARLLVELWPELGMRRATRQAWETAHPILETATASSHAA
jgi:hypothetical protein